MSLAEQWKYERAYEVDTYRMGPNRFNYAAQDIASFQTVGNYLDVGCGRAETLDLARAEGHQVYGIETVPQLCERADVQHGDVCALPFSDKFFDNVTCYDVLEHILPGEEQRALDEMGRVCRGLLFLSTNDRASKLPDGTELHVNKRKRDVWHQDFVRRWGEDNIVSSLKGPHDDWHWRIDVGP